MAKVKFKATEAMPEYHGFRSDFTKPEHLTGRLNLLDFKDGEVDEVCEADSKRLVADFPSNFVAVKAKARATKPKEEKTAVKKP